MEPRDRSTSGQGCQQSGKGSPGKWLSLPQKPGLERAGTQASSVPLLEDKESESSLPSLGTALVLGVGT